jgi:HEXXH motif-containing protein
MFADEPKRNLERHLLPADYFDVLAAGIGSRTITSYLWETERSRRLLLIGTVIRMGKRQTDLMGPLPPAENAQRILDAAREADHVAVESLLMHPQVGSAMAYALRRRAGGAMDGLPLWVDFGSIHAVALVAAAKTGLTWRTSVPARGGDVVLPTLGMARFTASDRIVQAHTESGLIRLSTGARCIDIESGNARSTETDDAVGIWLALRRLSVDNDGRRLDVWLDDLDPFRDLADPVPPARLSDDAVERWRKLLAGAWDVLCAHHAETADAMSNGVVSLVPLQTEPGWDSRSASNGEAFGSVMVSEPPDEVTLAVALVHEFQHIKLGALMHLLTIVSDDDGSLYYAPWRDDPRPLSGFLQGIYAFFGIAAFWRVHRLTVTGADAAQADYEYLYAREQTAEAIDAVRNAPALTEVGQTLVDRLAAVLTGWLGDIVNAEAERLCALTAGSHRTAWRIRHQRSTAAEVRALAEAWLRQDHPPTVSPPTVQHDSLRRWPQRIPTLARRRVRHVAYPDHRLASVLVEADRELVDGEVKLARDAYLAHLTAPTNGSDEETLAWVGLALSLDDSSEPAATAVMRSRPDLVRAVYTAVRTEGAAVDPVAVAAWLAPSVH